MNGHLVRNTRPANSSIQSKGYKMDLEIQLRKNPKAEKISNDIKYELKYFQTKKQSAGFNALSKNIFPFKMHSQKVYSLSKCTHPKL